MDTAQRVTNYLRVTVANGERGTRDDIDGALDLFRGEISCGHSDKHAITVIFTDHSALFMHMTAGGDVEIQHVEPQDVILFLQDAIMPVREDGTTDPAEALALLHSETGSREARQKIAERLHAALLGVANATA